MFSFRPQEKDPPALARLGATRDGWYGWFGYGGSVLQWHPQHAIGLGYTVTLFAWYDGVNVQGGQLQREALRCAERIEREREKEQ